MKTLFVKKNFQDFIAISPEHFTINHGKFDNRNVFFLLLLIIKLRLISFPLIIIENGFEFCGESSNQTIYQEIQFKITNISNNFGS